jgi:hypothetical protein
MHELGTVRISVTLTVAARATPTHNQPKNAANMNYMQSSLRNAQALEC